MVYFQLGGGGRRVSGMDFGTVVRPKVNKTSIHIYGRLEKGTQSYISAASVNYRSQFSTEQVYAAYLKKALAIIYLV